MSRRLSVAIVPALLTLLCLLAGLVTPPAAPTLICRMTGRPMVMVVVATPSRATPKCCANRRPVLAAIHGDCGIAAMLDHMPCCEFRAATPRDHVPAVMRAAFVPPVAVLAMAAVLVPTAPIAVDLPSCFVQRLTMPRAPPDGALSPRAPPVFS